MKKYVPYSYDEILPDVIELFKAKGYTDAEFRGSNAHNLSSIASGILSILGLNLNKKYQ